MDPGELFDSLTRKSVETFGTHLVIADACEDQVLLRHESHAVDDRIEDFTRVCCRPLELLDRILKVSHVPQLDTLSECAPTRHHIVVALADVDATARNGGLSSDGGCHAISTHVPEPHLAVPSTRDELVWRILIELAGEDLVGVCGVDSITNLLDARHPLFIIDFNVRLRTSQNEATSIPSVVDRMVLVRLVECDVLDRIAHAVVPLNDATVQTCAKKLLLLHVVVKGGLPSETGDGEVHLVILDLDHLITEHGADNLQGTIEETHCRKACI